MAIFILYRVKRILVKTFEEIIATSDLYMFLQLPDQVVALVLGVLNSAAAKK